MFSRRAQACLMSWLGTQSTTIDIGGTAAHRTPSVSFTNLVRWRQARDTKCAEALVASSRAPSSATSCVRAFASRTLDRGFLAWSGVAILFAMRDRR